MQIKYINKNTQAERYMRNSFHVAVVQVCIDTIVRIDAFYTTVENLKHWARREKALD